MSKDMLTEILDSVTAVQVFLTTDLARESLSPGAHQKRENFSQILSALCTKIRAVPPSMRPRMNTPSEAGTKKPPPPPPSIENIPEFKASEEDDGQEMYTDMEGVGMEEPTDYLAFEPSQTSGGDSSQEMYEAMTGEQDDDVYEEPVPGVPVVAEVSQEPELYEEPSSSDGRPSTSSSLQPPTPTQSRENSASGSEHIASMREKAQMERSAILADVSTDWNVIYSPPKKGTGDSKISSLKGISIKGNLEKLGGRNKKNWQKRYCVMSGPLMYFYEKESSKSYNNFICVLNFIVSKEPSMTNEKKKQFAFKLSQTDSSTGRKKDYCFRAISSETRDKWIMCIEKVLQKIPLPQSASSTSIGSATLPRMPSSNSSLSPIPAEPPKPRSITFAVDNPPEGEDGELYEDVPAPEPIPEEEEEEGDDYLPVSPLHEVEELSSSAEYVDVAPGDEVFEEEYEDTTSYQIEQPPPPVSPPPGPPTSHPPFPTPVSPPTFKPAPPPPVEVDTDKLYNQGSNGIILKNVFVSLWNFDAHEKDEMGLTRGDLVFVKDPNKQSDWWFGELLNGEATKKMGQKGLFPRQYADLAFEPVAS